MIYFLDYYYLVMQVKTKMITVNVKMKLSHKKDDQTNHRSLFSIPDLIYSESSSSGSSVATTTRENDDDQ